MTCLSSLASSNRSSAGKRNKSGLQWYFNAWLVIVNTQTHVGIPIETVEHKLLRCTGCIIYPKANPAYICTYIHAIKQGSFSQEAGINYRRVLVHAH